VVPEDRPHEVQGEDDLQGEGLVQQVLVPKELGEADEIFSPEAEGERGELVRYDPLRYYLLEISKFEPLKPEEEQRLARLYQEKQDLNAARRLVTSNLKLVVRIAFLYNRIYSNLMDLIQEGNVGLLHAVKKFDPDRGTRLPTYAGWWIKAYIIKFILDNFRIVKIGTTNDRRKILMNLRKEKQRLESRGIVATPRLIMSCSSSGFEERASAISSVMSFEKYAFARPWLKVCIPVCPVPVCIAE